MKGIAYAIAAASITMGHAAQAEWTDFVYFSPEITYQNSLESDLGSGIGLGGILGIDLTKFASIETELDYSSIAYEGNNGYDDFSRTRLGARAILYPFGRGLKVAPYTVVAGYGHYIDAFDDSFTGGSVSGGGGLLFHGVQGADLRLEGRYNVDYLEGSRTILADDITGWQVGLAVRYRLGYKPKLAEPTQTAPAETAAVEIPAECSGVMVDGNCVYDSDRDGILDNVDQCPDTPEGVAVSATGCAIDSDGDNVPDASDKCPNTVLGLAVDANGCASGAQTLRLEDVEFELDSDRLKRSTQIYLEKVAKGLLGQPTMIVELAGHTDSLGPESYNLTLSKERANAVRNFLISYGVPGSRLYAEGYGEFDPEASNDTAEGRQKNRRVEFRVIRQ